MRAKITVKGKRVQDVGYRLFLLSRAKGLVGFEAYNQDEDLVILVEGARLEGFFELVKKERPPMADVSEVIVEDYDGDVMSVQEYRSQLGLEQLAKIAIVGVELRDDIKEMKDDIKEMKVDIKEMKGDIKEMKGDIKEMLKKQDETLIEIRNLRSDLKSFMDERLRRIEGDIEAIKAKIGLR